VELRAAQLKERVTHMRAAFTLVELLVVITIIVILIALLTPALDRAIEMAERAKCGANLKAWGAGHAQYYLDHKRRILSAGHLRKGLARGLVPNHARYRSTTGEEAGDFNLDDIAPYVQGPNTGPWNNATYVGELWYCPSAIDTYFYRNVHDSQARVIEPGHPLNDDLSFMYLDYAYFGMAGSKYRNAATRPQRLSRRSIGEPGVLMSDTIFLWAGERRWWFNHSPLGPSMHYEPFGGYTHVGTPPPLNVNQLFADGSVAWNEDFEEELMAFPPDPQANAWLSSDAASSPPNPNAMINFY
jgi:prepilin-type N-terminal cleavage/methylation domain-containing protein